MFVLSILFGSGVSIFFYTHALELRFVKSAVQLACGRSVIARTSIVVIEIVSILGLVIFHLPLSLIARV